MCGLLIARAPTIEAGRTSRAAATNGHSQPTRPVVNGRCYRRRAAALLGPDVHVGVRLGNGSALVAHPRSVACDDRCRDQAPVGLNPNKPTVRLAHERALTIDAHHPRVRGHAIPACVPSCGYPLSLPSINATPDPERTNPARVPTMHLAEFVSSGVGPGSLIAGIVSTGRHRQGYAERLGFGIPGHQHVHDRFRELVDYRRFIGLPGRLHQPPTSTATRRDLRGGRCCADTGARLACVGRPLGVSCEVNWPCGQNAGRSPKATDSASGANGGGESRPRRSSAGPALCARAALARRQVLPPRRGRPRGPGHDETDHARGGHLCCFVHPNDGSFRCCTSA